MLSFWLSLSSEGEKKGDNLGGVGEYANGHSAEKKSSLLSFQNPDFLDKKAAETKSTVLTVRFTRNNKLDPSNVVNGFFGSPPCSWGIVTNDLTLNYALRFTPTLVGNSFG